MTAALQAQKGEIVAGRFPLLEHLGSSEGGSVAFLTECSEATGNKAVIKLIPAARCDPAAQLSQWEQAARLSHPNLLRMFHCGRTRAGDTDVLFAVMEYAEEDLGQILPQRALTADEVRQMLPSVLDALEYLHSRSLAHGRLKPSNVRASGDLLKLSCDGIVPFGTASANASGAADVWDLGMLLVEALTQKRPAVSTTGEATVPGTLPSPFLEISRQCLRRVPEQRWKISDIRAALDGKKVPSKVSSSTDTPQPAAKKFAVSKWHFAVPAMIIAIIVAVMVVHPRKLNHPETQPDSPVKAQAGNAPSASLAAPSPTPETPKADERGIVHQEIPQPSPGARRTIQGHIKVRVRVYVDSSGKVSAADFVTRGPSQYFARLAMEAAQEWEFAPASVDQRKWILTFSFARAGTQVFPAQQRR